MIEVVPPKKAKSEFVDTIYSCQKCYRIEVYSELEPKDTSNGGNKLPNGK